MTRPPLVVLAGATATGKTGLSIRIAEALRADGRLVEIISADSRQVYRGLDIGTAKIRPDERLGIPHHGLDLVEPDVRFTVGDFVRHAEGALARLAERRGIALLVGGTGLYLRAVGRGLDIEALPHDPTRRAALDAELERDGLGPLVARLREQAPRLAAAIDPRNPRRVLRALEHAAVNGDRPRPTPRGYGGPSLWLGLALADRALHDRRIGERAVAQFAAGLLEEAASLRRRWDPSLPAFSAIGYREAWSVLDGTATLEAAIALDAQRNRAFARRQATWFRSEPGIRWLEAAESPDRVAIDAVRGFLDALPVS